MGAHNAQDKLQDIHAVLPASGKKDFLEGGVCLKAWGPTVPADGTSGYATGCLFQHTDGGDGTALYVNEGTGTSCNFNAANVAA